MPFHALVDTAIAPILPIPCSFDPATIVVVDDDLAVLRSLQFFLESEGFHVAAFASSMDLLVLPELPNRGCFVIDYSMPLIDGLELAARLRARQSTLPAILMTGRLDPSIDQRAAHAGVFRVLRKPHVQDSLAGCIREALSMS